MKTNIKQAGAVGITMFCFLGAPAFGEDESLSHERAMALVNSAISAVDEDHKRNWAFTETTIDSDGTFVARWDPRRPLGRRWRLISVDGHAPTEEEFEEFEEEIQADDEDQRDDDDDVGDMVQSDTLTLIEETEAYWKFGFVPHDNDEYDFLEWMQGTLQVSKHGRFLERLNIESTESFRPATGIKVNYFLTRLTFALVGANKTILPLTVDYHVKMRAFLLMNIDEAGSVHYSDYEYVGD